MNGENTIIHISSKSNLNITFNLLQCGLNVIPSRGVISISNNDNFTLMYINHGYSLLETNGLGFKISSSQGFFAFPDTLLELRNISDEPLEVVWISFTGYLVEVYLNRANILRTKTYFTDESKVIGEKLNRIYSISQKMPNRYCPMMSIMYDIFGYLLSENPTKCIEGYVNNADFYAIKAVTFIELNYAMNISVDDIASAIGITRKHLYSVFNSVLKISPKQYLIYYRIEKSCSRLKSTNQSVLQVAESVGYTSQFYFSKEFKRITGMTPTQYKNDPRHLEVFGYLSIMASMKERAENYSVKLPVDEAFMHVIVPVK